MTSFRSRQLILLLVAFAVGAGSLLVAGSALAAQALFRAQRSYLNKPNPPVTTIGGAGKYMGYVQPYLTKSISMGDSLYVYAPGVATVEPGNPVGGAITILKKQFHDLIGTYTATPKTGWEGYTTRSYLSYYNGTVRVQPQNVHTDRVPSHIVFPTTNGNPYPNYGLGEPGPFGGPPEPTATFNGRYDFHRVGEINVTPGPRQFGGTYKLFHGPNNSLFYQYIYYFSPAIYKAYGGYTCWKGGEGYGNGKCNDSTFTSGIADTTEIYYWTRFLLNVDGTGTGDRNKDNTAKATTPYPNGAYPTVNGQGTPTGSGPASYVTGVQKYLNLIHPWTTGVVTVHNSLGSAVGGGDTITPQSEGYDIDLYGVEKLTVTRTVWDQVWNPKLKELTTTTNTYKDYLYGVGRVVSLVRPRLIHTYTVPMQRSTQPITMTWPAARVAMLKVWFLPEPTGMLMLGTGIAALLGLARIRRH
jgi:hypothetical protein